MARRTLSTLACSTAGSPEAEYYACSVAFAEVRHVMSFLADWGLSARCVHGTDSSSAIVHASRLGLGGLRHMEVRFLWVQNEVRSGRVAIKKIPGVENATDVATKHVDAATLLRCLTSAGMRTWSTSSATLLSATF